MVGFVHANWSLHARVAAVSPHPMLRSMYVNLLDHIESHTLAFLPYGTEPDPRPWPSGTLCTPRSSTPSKHRDRDRALHLIRQHNTPGAPGSHAGRLARAPSARMTRL